VETTDIFRLLLLLSRRRFFTLQQQQQSVKGKEQEGGKLFPSKTKGAKWKEGGSKAR